MSYNSISSDQLAYYLTYKGPGTPPLDTNLIRAFVKAGADPLVCRYGDNLNVFGIASYNCWSNKSWLELIDICKAGNLRPNKFTDGLAHYLTYQGPGTTSIDMNVIRAFVNAGADPLAHRYGDNLNIFGIASLNLWNKESWLELIDICKARNMRPNKFTDGLAHYIAYQGPKTPSIDLTVIKAFVNAGADPLARRYGDNLNLLEIASLNRWSGRNWLELNNIVKLYNNTIKSSTPTAIHETSIQEFDQRFNEFSAIVAQLKTKMNRPFDFQQNYKAASIAGEKLLRELKTQRTMYAERKINLEEFRINCGASIKTALHTDLVKSHGIRRALVSFLNFVMGLTIVVPVVTKITTGRWGLFTNTVTESEKGIRKIENNLRGLRDSGSDLPQKVYVRHDLSPTTKPFSRKVN